MGIRSTLRRFTVLRVSHSVVSTLANQFGLNVRWVSGLARFTQFGKEYRTLRELNQGSPFALRATEIEPYLLDRTSTTPVEPVYFLQDTWFARRIAENVPRHHVDVGSSAKTMALVGQFVPVTMVDIRPVEIEVDGFTFIAGSALQLPFGDATLASVSSLCVIEHIGLGRYGDALDARGSEHASAELIRVLARGGDLYVSVPVDSACRIYFNAHRAFTRDYLLSLFASLELKQERYIYGRSVHPDYNPLRGFGTGLYHFRRP